MIDETERLYERVLVLRCQMGDESAFEELVALSTPTSLLSPQMLREIHRAEDALQEVWLDVFRAVGRLADAGAFRSWVYRIARDRAFREFRKHPLPFQSLAEVELVDESTEEAEFSVEDAAQIHIALNELTAEQREAVVLQYIEGMSYEEIARVTGCPLGTVRSRLYYAKLSLRRILERMKIHE